MRAVACFAAALAAMSLSAQGQGKATVYAAGSLRAALTEAAAAFKARSGGEVAFEFGPSGLLRDRLNKGESADVFASANMEHPKALADAGKAAPVRMFARNRMCAIAPAKAGVTTDNVLDRMLDPKVKLGTSTPKADPSGDYAWAIFERAEKVKSGSFETLSKKALQLVGGPTSPPPPQGRSAYGALVAGGQADVFLTYCTNAVIARKEEPSLALVSLPENLAVGADYGLATMNGASAGGKAFAEFLLSAEGRKVLESQGFSPARPVSVPADRLYDLDNDLWIRVEGAEVVIGPTRRGIDFAGDIVALTTKVAGTEVDFDRGLAVVEVSKTVIALHSPLTLVVITRNEAAMRDPSILVRDPYGDGWIVRARATRWPEESGRLVHAARYEGAA